MSVICPPETMQTLVDYQRLCLVNATSMPESHGMDLRTDGIGVMPANLQKLPPFSRDWGFFSKENFHGIRCVKGAKSL
jgi:hypothetical protein